ncbi:MAG: agmatine deiminase family protein [Saprospiraceae bacterium]|nr:agmatine deiminase family protein [Saprospiraceae bacterium]
MRTKTTLVLFLALTIIMGSNAQTNELPRFATDAERQLEPPLSLLTIGITTPPLAPVRTMAEWEELQSLIITWNGQSTILTEIVRAARLECKVLICCSSQQVVNLAKNKLTSSGVDITSNVEFIIAPNDSIWVRDYGPNSVYANDVDSLYFVDWIYNRPSRPKDDTIATSIAPYFGVPLYSTSAAPTDLVNTGGNFMSDGMGTAFASSLILNENEFGNPYGVTNKTEAQIDGIMSDFMGIDRYIKMTPLPYDVIHHIDMHMKLLDEETLLVGQYPAGVADGPQIEANIQYVLDNFKSSFGTPYKVVRIPMPPEAGQYPNTTGDYRTYANAVFVNKTILVPFYEQAYDTTAQRVWQESMPGYKVVGINCNSIIPSLGAIHCITKEVGVNEPLRIVHQALECQDNGNTPGGYPIYATIQHRTGITGAKLFYTTDLFAPWQSTDMWQGIIPNDDWFGSIPSQPGGSTVYYYIEGTAVNGKTLARPITAPDGWWKFCVSLSSKAEEPLAATLLNIYPNPASAVTVVPLQSSAKTYGSILVFNSLGQMVQKVFAGEIPAGNSNHFLDAGRLASGAYFVKLQTGGQVQMKKLVVR